jgi:hypothetical protein
MAGETAAAARNLSSMAVGWSSGRASTSSAAMASTVVPTRLVRSASAMVAVIPQRSCLKRRRENHSGSASVAHRDLCWLERLSGPDSHRAAEVLRAASWHSAQRCRWVSSTTPQSAQWRGGWLGEPQARQNRWRCLVLMAIRPSPSREAVVMVRRSLV